MTEKYTNYNLEWDAEEMMRRAAEIRTVEESWKELPFSRYSVNQKDHKLELAPKPAGFCIGGICPRLCLFWKWGGTSGWEKAQRLGLGTMIFLMINKVGGEGYELAAALKAGQEIILPPPASPRSPHDKSSALSYRRQCRYFHL